MFYKKNKEEYIKIVAKKYYDEKAISERVYNALMNYKLNNLELYGEQI